jgi:periplasmic divalent cation tolerance protein
MAEGLVIALTTCANIEEAERLAHRLVEARLAACVSIGQTVRSVYPWDGKVNVDEEVPLMIKTAPERTADLKRMIEADHPYDVPELLLIASDDGLQAYQDWARDWVGAPSRNDME